MTDPLTTPDMDVTGITGFILDAQRLLGSETWAIATGDEAKAAVTLWCRSWGQKPAASIPNDDRVLAAWCGLAPRAWAKVKEVALRGFIECSDGRLYHRVLAEDVKRASDRRKTNAERASKGGQARAATSSRSASGQLEARSEPASSTHQEVLNPAPSPSPFPSPVPIPEAGAGEGRAPTPTPPPWEESLTSEGREMLTLLRELTLSASAEAIEEWDNAVCATARSKSPEEDLAAIRWAVLALRKAGNEVRYARQAVTQLAQWPAHRPERFKPKPVTA